MPNLYAVAATAVVPSLLSQTQGLLRQYGLFGELVHVGGVGAVFTAFVYVETHVSCQDNADPFDRIATEREYLVHCYKKFRSRA